MVRVPKEADTLIGGSVLAYIKLRNVPGSTETVLRTQLVVDELEGVLCRFVMNSHNLNGQASDPAVRKALEIVAARDQMTGIAKHYPGDPWAFRKGSFKSKLVREAARRAMASVPPPRRGRPKGTSNKAAQELIHELTGIYRAYLDKRPSRSVVNEKVCADITGRHEGGRFMKFCELVITALPAEYLDRITRDGGGLASLIRRELAS